ncbi:hypothetical protein NE237_008473 [Protea cynaroides]|uniref:F-box associated beta-propeller type 3 domain-containing protein n=1 Tax=Protea cynaroides TaxID=273540 RepID=A0A9Q0KVL7_9MAGN|nr:hypothetical protein NE237_008473 [Protea cynaroides]
MVNGEGDWKTREIPMDFELKSCGIGKNLEIVGSCNGSLCIARAQGSHPVCLLNPVTRERMMLPKSQIILPPTISNPRYCVSFGFDSLSNKYKVVKVYYEEEKFHGEDDVFYDESSDDDDDDDEYVIYEKPVKGFCEIITVGESSWRELDCPRTLRENQEIYGSHNSNPVFLDGTLYWLIDNSSRFKKIDILALDMDVEKFWSIKCPRLKEFRKRRSLLVVDGSLAIIDYHKTMGFSFNLTTYDMSGLRLHLDHWGDFSVIAKLSHDTFLLQVQTMSWIVKESWIVKKLRTVKKFQYSIVLYSPTRQQCSFIHGKLNEFLRPCWMVPTFKSLKATVDR